MRRGAWAEDPTELRQQSRHGAIKVATLEGLGVSQRTAYRRCVPGGPWQRPLPGIILLTNAQPTRLQLVEAALLFVGSDTMVTGLEACRRYGLRVASDDPAVHVLVPHDRKVKSIEYVIIERTTRLPDPVVRDGVPLAPPARSVLDACRKLRAFDPVRSLISEVVQRGQVPPGLLAHELEMGSQRGTAVAREVLKDVLAGARSVAEIDGRRVWERTGLPPCDWNVDLLDGNGRFLARPDGWCDAVAMAWEIDSYEYQFGRTDYARTLERNARYVSAGVVLVQTIPTRLRNEPEAVAAELRAAYRAAAARARPPVEVRKRMP